MNRGEYVVVLSTVSGRKRRSDIGKDIRAFFEERSIPCRILPFNRRTQSLDDLHLPSVIGTHTAAVIAVGGDGILRSVVGHLIENNLDIPVGFVPRGSTNLFAKAHGIPTDVRAALGRIVSAVPVELPVGYLNDKHPFLLAVCFGRFAEYTLQADAGLKRMIGFGAYVVAALARMFHFPRHNLRLVSDDAEHELHAHSVLVCLPQTSKSILPDMPSTGRFRTVAFSNYSLTGLFHALIEFYGFKMTSQRAFHASGDRVVLHGPFKGRVHLDGDHVHLQEEQYVIAVAPRMVRFLL